MRYDDAAVKHFYPLPPALLSRCVPSSTRWRVRPGVSESDDPIFRCSAESSGISLSRDVVVHLLAGGGLDHLNAAGRFPRRLRHGALHLSRQVVDQRVDVIALRHAHGHRRRR